MENIYYGGFDAGSCKAGLQMTRADGMDLATESVTIESTIADMDLSPFLNWRGGNGTIASALHSGECLISWNGWDYALGNLVIQGRNPRDESGNSYRYWGDHAKVLLLALACMLVPEQTFVLRLVTALPIMFSNRENRERMKSELSSTYQFEYNGQPREISVIVGHVMRAGEGILLHSGQDEGKQAVMDIGERTLDCIAYDGPKRLAQMCGGTALGIGHITDAVKAVGKRYSRLLATTRVHTILSAYLRQQPLPVIKAGTAIIPEEEIIEAITTATSALARRVLGFAENLWNVEGRTAGTYFERITLGGGGAYYLGNRLASALPQVVIAANPEHANMAGYMDLALALEEQVPGIWEQD